MDEFEQQLTEIDVYGFTVIENVLDADEVEEMRDSFQVLPFIEAVMGENIIPRQPQQPHRPSGRWLSRSTCRCPGRAATRICRARHDEYRLVTV